ncbi:putative reverse transcriptase domain-containing protein [Tanacetum coccineum]
MITTNNRIKGEKPSRLMLPPRLKTVGHQTRNCKNKGPTTGSNMQPVSVTCYVCGEKGHYRNQCPKANKGARGKAYMLRDKERSLRPKRSHRILKRVGLVAYTLELLKELSNVHNTFHVSNLKKYLFDESLIIPIKELRLDDKLNFVEEPVEIMDREVKQLKPSCIPIVKVRWNSKRGPKFT